MTNMFLSWCQSLLTTSQSKVSPELIDIFSTVLGLGIESTSITLLNRTSLLLMVSRSSLSSRFTRSEGIRRLISTVCGMKAQTAEYRTLGRLGSSGKTGARQDRLRDALQRQHLIDRAAFDRHLRHPEHHRRRFVLRNRRGARLLHLQQSVRAIVAHP